MRSSWKRLASDTTSLLVAAAAAAAFFVAQPASAAGCPTTPVADHGGQHWCYTHDSQKGNVHLWTPPGYKADTAVTVIYVHGLDTGRNGPDTCNKKRPYVDCIWDASDHDIVGQFAASGVNALFVAVEGPILSTNEGIKWGSLSSLFNSISTKGKVTPPTAVTVLGHSAGMYTARALWPDARVKHLVSLDWVDGALEGQVKSWFQQGDRKLTLVGGSGGQQTIMDRMEKDLLCTRAASSTSLTEAELAVNCLYMRTGANHMGVVLRKTFIPQAIKRSSSASTAGATTPAPSGAVPGSTVTSRTLADADIAAPLLEVPIPGLELSGAVRTNGQITIPWLAQYVGGVYTFLLSIAGMLAAVMMVVGGFQYVTSAGDKGKLGAGKQKIMNALTGLVLALGSYTILYAINPGLVAFEGLKIGAVNSELFANEDYDPGIEFQASAGSGPNVTPPGPTETSNLGFADGAQAFCHGRGCDDWCRQHSDPATWPHTTPGYMPVEQTVVVANYKLSDAFPGASPDRVLVYGNGGRAHPKVRDALYAAAKQAAIDYPNNKYSIHIGECWRSVETQIRYACVGKPGAFTGAVANIGSAVAEPGGSNHGVGYACDLKLFDGEVNQLPTPKPQTKSQCDVKPENSKRFNDIMFKVGWVRYEAEVWHFEFGSPTKNRCGPNAKHGGPAECVFPPKKFCS